MKKIVLVIILIIFILLSLSLIFAQIIIGAKNGEKNKELYENEVSIYSYDGLRLAAEERVQNNYTNKWVIFVHSYRTSKEDFKNYTDVYFEKGYNVLSPDNRAHGKSEGEYIGMGYYEELKKKCIAYNNDFREKTKNMNESLYDKQIKYFWQDREWKNENINNKKLS